MCVARTDIRKASLDHKTVTIAMLLACINILRLVLFNFATQVCAIHSRGKFIYAFIISMKSEPLRVKAASLYYKLCIVHAVL